MANNLFTPSPKSTVSITCALTSASVKLNNGNVTVIRVYNADTVNVAYVEFGDSTVTASVPAGSTKGSMPIGPGEIVGVTVPIGSAIASGGSVYAAAICSAGTPQVFFTPGLGT